MLTPQAFNALLRTLEEPPAHGKFIFATTDIHRIPATIISRCQRFDFNRISLQVISDRLEFILEEEGIPFDTESINAISRKADGSMRDALSLLDQSISYCGEKINYEGVVKTLGLITDDLYFNFTESIREKNAEEMVKLLATFSGFGVPAAEVLVGIGEHIRNIMYGGIKNGASLLEMNEEHKKKYVDEATNWDRRDLLRMSQVLIDVSSTIRRAEDPYLLLEMTALKLLDMDQSVLIDDLLNGKTIPTNPIVETSPKTKSISVQKNQKSGKAIYTEPEKKIVDSKSVHEKQESDSKKIPLDANEKPAEPKLSTKVKEEDTEITIEFILEKWPSIIQEIHLERPSVGAILEECNPLKLDKNNLTIKSLGKSGFNVKMIERGIPIIEKIIAELLNKSIKVQLVNGNENESSIEKTDIKTETKPNPNEEKVFNKIIEVFDGEILR
jgi:DNA polymerase-3 subunit gamma/tau